jgi:ParB family chromosome partitioning protein
VNKPRRLGRGLEALLGRTSDEAESTARYAEGGTQTAEEGERLVTVGVYDIDRNPAQPRRDFDEAEISSLADSLHEHGLLQPIVVRRVAERYQLIAGERRLRAAIKAGWPEVPCQLIEADDRKAAELAIVENLQRKDLNALEKAASFADYLRQYGTTQEELAARLKVDRSTVANLIRLLELPEQVKDSLRAGRISQGHARALLALGEPVEQIGLCNEIECYGLSVRATEEAVQKVLDSDEGEAWRVVGDEEEKPRGGRRPQPHMADLEQRFRVALGTKVEIRQTTRGKGRIIVHFKGHDEFERLERQFCSQGKKADAV